MTGAKLTEAQKRALLWLPADGAWTLKESTRDVSAALGSLTLYHRDLARSGWLKTPRGRRYLAFRLTPAGIAARQAGEEGR